MKKITRVLLLTVGLGIIFALIIYANPQKFLSMVYRSNKIYVATAVLISLFNIFLRVIKWNLLLGNVKFCTIFPIQILGSTISNLTPGKIGEPIKSVLLKMRLGMPVSKTLPSIFWDRILDIFVLILLSCISIILFITLPRSFGVIAYLALTLILIAMICALLFLSNKKFRKSILSIITKMPMLNKLDNSFADKFYEAKTQKKILIVSFLITVVVWVFEGLIIHYAFMSIGINVSPIVLSGLFSLATIIGIVSALPGGIGSTDVVMIIFLGILGVDHSAAVTGFILSRFFSIWLVNFLGAISLLYMIKKSNMNYKNILV